MSRFRAQTDSWLSRDEEVVYFGSFRYEVVVRPKLICGRVYVESTSVRGRVDAL